MSISHLFPEYKTATFSKNIEADETLHPLHFLTQN